MAILQLQTFLDFLGIPAGSAEQPRLQIIVNSLNQSVPQYLGRDIALTTYPSVADGGCGDSGYYNGDWTKYLKLRQFPVISISSIYEDASARWGQNPDGAFASTTLLTAGTDYAIEWDGYTAGAVCSFAGLVQRLPGVWPGSTRRNTGNINPLVENAPGNIKVAYTAGYATIPADIIAAACLIGAFMRRMARAGGWLTSESQGAYSYTIALPMLNAFPELGSARQLLSRYKRPSI